MKELTALIGPQRFHNEEISFTGIPDDYQNFLIENKYVYSGVEDVSSRYYLNSAHVNGNGGHCLAEVVGMPQVFTREALR